MGSYIAQMLVLLTGAMWEVSVVQVGGASTSKATGEDDSGAGCSKAASDADGEDGDVEEDSDSDEVCDGTAHSIDFRVSPR